MRGQRIAPSALGPSGHYDQERLGSLVASAKVQAETILAGLAQSEAPTQRTQALVDLLRSGAQHYSRSLDGLRDAIAERYGSVRQAELSDESAKEELRGQRDLLAFTLKALEIGDVELSAEADDALKFLDAYTGRRSSTSRRPPSIRASCASSMLTMPRSDP